MNLQTRRLIMWNDHAQRWEPIKAINSSYCYLVY